MTVQAYLAKIVVVVRISCQCTRARASPGGKGTIAKVWLITAGDILAYTNPNAITTSAVTRAPALPGGQVTTASLTSTSARASRASTAANALTWLVHT
eukprot:SAG22_NODE_8953_length_618_cov_5.828516_1_plen_97_part_01